MAAAHAGPSREADDATISSIEAMRADGRYSEAQDRYSDIVRRHQRRAIRIAYHMLCDPADADEVVQDAFVKAYKHLPSFQRQLPFEIWFTRILTNSCRDRIRTRSRRERRFISVPSRSSGQQDFWDSVAAVTTSPEDRVLARERRQTLLRALRHLPPASTLSDHVEPFRGANGARGERPDRVESVDDSCPSVSRTSHPPDAPGRKPESRHTSDADGRSVSATQLRSRSNRCHANHLPR